MSINVKKIGVLTSSRADYGIYQPLLKALSLNVNFELHLLVFGTHLLPKYGETIHEVQSDGYGIIHRIEGMPSSDSVKDIAKGYSDVLANFVQFWSTNSFDIVLALGDRFEMSAAVQASIPFEIKLGHIHGGETTLGAIDNIYRHQISLASQYHFVASEVFVNRLINLLDTGDNIYNVGSLSLSELAETELPAWDKVAKKFDIPTNDFVLVTLHPETVHSGNNEQYAEEAFQALSQLCNEVHIVITLANADTNGRFFRVGAERLKSLLPNQITLVENFGKLNYFSAMKQCKFMCGNTSSGIIESASFGKYVVNVGDRQKGRLRSENVVDVSFSSEKIYRACSETLRLGAFKGLNLYYKKDSAKAVINILEHA
jgi:GDP/UDP-N,N'-diacetylbacillosamine 2-epimerase (hydrolysing)